MGAKQGKPVDDDARVKGRAAASGKSKADRPKVAEALPPVTVTSPTVENITETAGSTNTTATPTIRLLSSVRGLLERLSKLTVKFVHRIFPWNRRARRRVLGDGEDEEL